MIFCHPVIILGTDGIVSWSVLSAIVHHHVFSSPVNVEVKQFIRGRFKSFLQIEFSGAASAEDEV
jgi:hypothetical protein